MRRGVLFACVLAGCYQPSFAPCQVKCSDGTTCPSGFSCSDGRCRPAASTASCDAILDARDDERDSQMIDGQAMDAPHCGNVVCDDGPAPSCTNNTLRTYARTGTCEAGACEYAFTERACTSAGCSANVCTGGWITPTNTLRPTERYGHSAVWTGTEMITFSGRTSNTSAVRHLDRYNPTTGSWANTVTDAGLSTRHDHTAVWTGTEMIVWGGMTFDEDEPYGDGARFHPSTGTWTALPMTGAPSPRFGHSAVWTGSEMIIWGGANGPGTANSLADGGRYNPSTNTWTEISANGAPTARRDHTAVWTGSEMIVYGGVRASGTNVVTGGTARFDPATGAWSSPPETNVIVDRYKHVAVWTGSEMLV